MNNLFTDIAWHSLNKEGEQLCGDQVSMARADDGSLVMVLADGLGSGVKACILSTLTSKIISTMIARSMSIEDCIATIAATLPVCEERQLAYSTFTVIKVSDNREAEIIQYDNPNVIFLRNGKNRELPLAGMEIGGKTIYRAKAQLQENDTLVAVSDGALHAGPGITLNLNWEREHVVDFLELEYADSLAAKALTTILLDECRRLYCGKPRDDTTVCTIKVRPRNPVNLLIGPPLDPTDDHRLLSLFFSKEGKRIVCGGTTAGMTADFLDKKVEMETLTHDPEIPPTMRIEGVDLVTEGIITLNRAVYYARDFLGEGTHYFDWNSKNDGASLLARILLEEATDIHFYVGRAVNKVYQDTELPLAEHTKLRLVDELAACLKQLGKNIKVSYF